MIEEQEIRAELIKIKLEEGMEWTDNEFDCCFKKSDSKKWERLS